MGKRMTYEQVYQTLALYAPVMLPVFADKWSRFPEGRFAEEIIAHLDMQARGWAKISPEVVAKITAAKAEIEYRNGTERTPNNG